MTTGTFKTTIEVSANGIDGELDIVVEYEAHPFRRGATDGRCGPKIEPDEPAHIEITSVKDDLGREHELTIEQEEWIEEQIAEDLADAEDFARSEYYDGLRDGD